MQLQSKQISKFIAAFVALTNQAVSNASSLNVTSALTTALATAGNNGVSVPLNANGSASIEGVIANSTSIVPVYSYPSGVPIEIAGAQVYGVITYATSVYTVNFFTLAAGVQKAATINGPVNLLIPYSFTFADLPYTALLTAVDTDPGGPGAGGGSFFVDTSVTITGNNAVSNLAKQPIDPNSVILYVNGQALASGVNFSVAGQAITVSAGQIAATGFNLSTSDSIFAMYAY